MLEPVFVAQGVHREALAALHLFVDAARKDQATVELTERVLAFLRRSRYNSEVHFDAKGGAPSPERRPEGKGEGAGR